MKLTQEEKTCLRFALESARSLVKILEDADSLVYQTEHQNLATNVDDVRSQLLSAMGHTMNVHAYLLGTRKESPTQ